jgi:hypothetical protein
MTVRIVVERRARWVALGLLASSLGVLLGTVLIGLSPSVRGRLGWGGRTSTSYAVGETIDVPPEYFSTAPQTLVLFVSGTCGATLRSASMLGGVAARLKDSQTRVVIFSPAERQADQALLARRMGVDRAALVPMDLTHYRVRIVPSAVLVDQQGRVRFAQEGALGLVEQQAILDAVAAAESRALARTSGV